MFDRSQNTRGSGGGSSSGSSDENRGGSSGRGGSGGASEAGTLGRARGRAFERRKVPLRTVRIGPEVGGFNFQEWAELAQRDPAAFEVRRRQAIERFLNAISPGQRRRCTLLQREIDAARRQADDPRKSLLALAQMMCQELSFLGEGLRSLSFSTGRFIHPKMLGERRLLARAPRP